MSARDCTAADPAQCMDRMYRYQRHIYDLTRRHYLLGRDRLLRRMEVAPGDRVLEVGCGTGRNLVRLARLYPEAKLYGLDASEQMLRTARGNLRRAGAAGIALRQCLAETLCPARTFGLDRPFDAIVFSYALSMIPPWRQALAAAVRALRPEGRIYIVDFWDQADLPAWFRAILRRWLALFHVRHEPALLEAFRALENVGCARLSLESVARRYAYIAVLSDLCDTDRLQAVLAEE